eukprot:13181420-Ditylum_brightwellii.AAC.1
MEESQLPRKFINAWHPQAHPVGCPLTTIRHTCLHILKYAKVILKDGEQDNSDDDKAGSPQHSVVGSGTVQNWYSGVADMVEAQTKDHFAKILWEMQANKSSLGMGNMCSQL